MIVIGIDPGIVNLAVCVLDYTPGAGTSGAGTWKIIHWELIDLKPYILNKKAFAQNLPVAIKSAFDARPYLHKPDQVIIELQWGKRHNISVQAYIVMYYILSGAVVGTCGATSKASATTYIRVCHGKEKFVGKERALKGKKNYSKRKNIGIEKILKCLTDNKMNKAVEFFGSAKKKQDDLADALILALTYLPKEFFPSSMVK